MLSKNSLILIISCSVGFMLLLIGGGLILQGNGNDQEDNRTVREASTKDDAELMDNATRTGNMSICQEISNRTKQLGCMTVVEEMNTFEAAVMEHNISRCDSFSEPDKRQECRDNFYLAKAINEQDFSWCAEITSQTLRGQCEDAR